MFSTGLAKFCSPSSLTEKVWNFHNLIGIERKTKDLQLQPSLSFSTTHPLHVPMLFYRKSEYASIHHNIIVLCYYRYRFKAKAL